MQLFVISILLVALFLEKQAVDAEPGPPAEPYKATLGKQLFLRCGFDQIAHLVKPNANPKYVEYISLKKVRDSNRQAFNRLKVELYSFAGPEKRKVFRNVGKRDIEVDFIGVTDDGNITREMGLKENVSIAVKIKKVTCDDIGLYECTVHMPTDGNTTAYAFFILHFYVDTVEHNPQISVRPDQTKMGMGDTVSITCSIITSMTQLQMSLRVKSPVLENFINLPADKSVIETGKPGLAYIEWPSTPIKTLKASFIGECTNLTYRSLHKVIKFVVDSELVRKNEIECYVKEKGYGVGPRNHAVDVYSAKIYFSKCPTTEDVERPCGYESTGPDHKGDKVYPDLVGYLTVPPTRPPPTTPFDIDSSNVRQEEWSNIPGLLILFGVVSLVCLSFYIIGAVAFSERNKMAPGQKSEHDIQERASSPTEDKKEVEEGAKSGLKSESSTTKGSPVDEPGRFSFSV